MSLCCGVLDYLIGKVRVGGKALRIAFYGVFWLVGVFFTLSDYMFLNTLW